MIKLLVRDQVPANKTPLNLFAKFPQQFRFFWKENMTAWSWSLNNPVDWILILFPLALIYQCRLLLGGGGMRKDLVSPSWELREDCDWPLSSSGWGHLWVPWILEKSFIEVCTPHPSPSRNTQKGQEGQDTGRTPLCSIMWEETCSSPAEFQRLFLGPLLFRKEI
jgi:hypothetical protein